MGLEEKEVIQLIQTKSHFLKPLGAEVVWVTQPEYATKVTSTAQTAPVAASGKVGPPATVQRLSDPRRSWMNRACLHGLKQLALS